MLNFTGKSSGRNHVDHCNHIYQHTQHMYLHDGLRPWLGSPVTGDQLRSCDEALRSVGELERLGTRCAAAGELGTWPRGDDSTCLSNAVFLSKTQMLFSFQCFATCSFSILILVLQSQHQQYSLETPGPPLEPLGGLPLQSSHEAAIFKDSSWVVGACFLWSEVVVFQWVLLVGAFSGALH